MPESPAALLRRAAEKMRATVTDARWDLANLDYWACDHPEATEDEIYRHGIENGLGGNTGSFAAQFTPSLGLLIADQWDALAAEVDGLRYAELSMSASLAVDGAELYLGEEADADA